MPRSNTPHRAQFASALSTAAEARQAVSDVCERARAVSSVAPSLSMLFVSQDHQAHFTEIAGEVRADLRPDCLIGCTAESIVAGRREVEREPAIALWSAWFHGTQVSPMHLRFENTPEGAAIVGWRDDLVDTWPDDAAMLLLGEPFTFPADYLLQRLNEDRPGTRVIGGMASGGAVPGENRLLLDGQVLVDGAVAVLLHGGLRVRTVVSQGCRPIGHPLVITRAEQNIIYELGGRPAMLRLKDIFDGLPNRDKQLIQRGLHVGLVVNEYQDRFEYGDFWMRNVTGGDLNEGYVTVGEFVRPGQTIQFHVRDEQSAHHDLIQLLRQHQQTEDAAPEGALLFTCNGRGTRLFLQPDHDASAIAETFGDIPLAGFFAQGELGPISNKNFLHGFTASIALFYA